MLGVYDILKWSVSRDPRSVAAMYDVLSPLMCGIAGSRMLNFGYWDDAHDTPALAQENMCGVVSDMAELGGPLAVVDVGCGFCAPAAYWKRANPELVLHCVNTSYAQLRGASGLSGAGGHGCNGRRRPSGVVPDGESSAACKGDHGDGAASVEAPVALNAINSSATALPLASGSVDRIIALESAQHFRPLGSFVSECRRLLSEDGILAVAIPVVTRSRMTLARLGILNFTWASEHYLLSYVRRTLHDCGFGISDERLVGDSVYGPLADYYLSNRRDIRKAVRDMGYPSYLEPVMAISMRKMGRASSAGIIQYALLKCRPRPP